ncbi:PREDICTED: coiled-coil domain-containing protein 38 [Acanthisitta chloris]|uniref:coiled-coil domain-containing protein 38 n=1 Tax=Acanthisitta chloris TaxID=57068 RepID=UPI0004F0CD54|nr:PREDICTED: coiled-coil domain-containing protein 38 [Acanthisitta chloris]
MKTQLALSESPEEGGENAMKNPFTIPPGADIFSIGDKERKKAKEEHERMKTMKVHEKTTYSTRIKANSGLWKALQKEEEENRKAATNDERLKTLPKYILRKLAMQKDYSLEKETIHDYINARREMCLLEYYMAVKQDEIEKMENIVKNEIKKLEKAERQLEKDAAMFEESLKESHKNSVQALRIARKETSEKTKKATEIQAITSEINNVQRDISEFKDTLQECKMYRDILYQLSPKEWREEHGKKHTKEKDLKTEESRDNEGSALPPLMAEEGQGLAARTNTASPHCTTYTDLPSSLLSSEGLDFGSFHGIRPRLRHFLKPLLTRKLSSLEDAGSETSSDEEEEPELYFTDPQQLLNTFTEMEEENIHFIQNSQEAEESWNKVQHTFITTHESMEKELAELKEQVNTLRASVAKEEERVADLKFKVHLFSSGEHNAGDQDRMLTSLKKKVLEVYCQCTGDNETNLDTVQMLKVIEKQLSDLLDNLEGIPPEKMEQAKKSIKKEWRTRLREGKLRQQKQQQEERLKRAMEISPATVEKKAGTSQSSPPARKQKKKNSKGQIDKEEEEQLYYFT